MKWWCSATSLPWSWSWRPYPGVWLFIALLFSGLWRWNRAGAAAAGRATPPLHPLFLGGLLLLWLSLDWPIGALGSGYLASVHMLQFLLMGLAAPPLLLRGISVDALAMLERNTRTVRVINLLTAPRVALIVFNAVVLLTHLPPVVDSLMTSQAGSLLIDLTWITTGMLFWWPVILPTPARPRFSPPLKMGYLVVGMMFSPVMFGLAAFLAYSQTPLYGIFELAPPLPGISSHTDHQLAGVMMSVGGATIAFIGMSVIFFRWSKESA
jgi:putative membrane protein